MRFLPRKGLFLFIALRWMQPDRGMMWQAENQELARDFPAGTASKARQSRLHQAQGVFPVFVFHSFVQFLNINVPKIVQFARFVSKTVLHQGASLRERSVRWRRWQSESRWHRKVEGTVRVGGKVRGCAVNLNYDTPSSNNVFVRNPHIFIFHMTIFI